MSRVLNDCTDLSCPVLESVVAVRGEAGNVHACMRERATEVSQTDIIQMSSSLAV